MDRVVANVVLSAWVAVLATGCVGLPPPPDPVRVEPAWGYRDDDTPVRIVGTSFFPSLDVPALGPDDGPDDGFSVELRATGRDAVPLVGVRLDDLNTLVGVVPRGLVPGAYDVAVRAPSGLVGVEPVAFEVRGTRVERVRLDVEAVRYEVFEEAPVRVRLVDADDAPVEEDLPVVLTLRRSDGAPFSGTARVEGLEDPVRSVSGAVVTLRGRLGDDGTAVVLPLLQSPGDLEVDVAVDDEAARIAGDDLRIAFTRGTSLEVRVTLPSPDFATVAGEPFPALLELVDQFGNVATDASATVAVTDSCASFATGVRIDGSEDVTLIPTAATETTRCATNRVVVSGAGVSGVSESFRVTPGEAVGLDVVAGPVTMEAGEVVSAFVGAVDAWGNLAAWSGEVVVLDDDVGGIGDASCGEPGDLAFCTATLVRAGPRRLVVSSREGLVGTSNPVTVRPGAPVRLEAAPALTWEAGVAEVVAPWAADAWGNVVPEVVVDPFDVQALDPAQEIACAPTVGGVLACRLFTATPSTSVTLSAAVGPESGDGPSVLTGSVGPIQVRHGAFDAVDVTPDRTTVTAGDSVSLALRARDAWGNTCDAVPPPAVRLDDSLGVSPGVAASLDVALGFDGTASVDLPLYVAGVTAIVARVGGAEVGRSPPITVLGGPPERLLVEWLSPWAWVGEPVGVRVAAVDAYENRSFLDGVTIDLVSRVGLGEPVALPMVAGVATGAFVFERWSLDDALVAEVREAPSLDGASVDRMLLRRCGSGPVVDVRFAGLPYARACTDADGEVRIAGDFAASRPASGGAVARYGLALDGEPAVAVTPRVATATRRVGVRALRAAVQQTDGCGDEVVTSAFLGPDDGGAVGPLEVRVLGVGDVAAPSPGVQVQISGATTCHGLPASGATLRVRSDRGAIVGATPSGAGLEVLADARGEASFAIDLSGDDSGGGSRVSVAAPSGAAIGWSDHVVAGDRRLPTVIAQEPEGATATSFDAITVTFSEPLHPESVSPSAVRLVGAAERPVSLALVGGGRTLVVRVDSPIPADVGASALVLDPSLRDLAGLPLDGAWTGAAGRYTGYFGEPGSPVLVTRCEVDRPVLRPDGDPGSVPEEGDSATLSFAADGLPAWWHVEVRDALGGVVAARQLRGTGGSGQWTWDARDLTGRVVGTGPYSVSVAAENASGSRANACARSVVVDLVEP